MNIEFKNLLSEINHEDHEIIHNWMKENPNKLAFTNLFKDKIRVILPPTNQKDAINILEKIKNANDNMTLKGGKSSTFDSSYTSTLKPKISNNLLLMV
jgi:hypothetical protein